MAERVAKTSLNASTIDILNVIRLNSNAEYQGAVPEMFDGGDIRQIGAVIAGNPSFSNQFIHALVNQIAFVRVKSVSFNNPYVDLKKGFLQTGETIEEVFVSMAKAREFSVEKAAAREFKRSLPKVQAAFHVMNWRVQYPVTVQQSELRMAFNSMGGVTDMIARIIRTVYDAAEYDEFLLFKYLIIKAVASGKMKYVSVNASDPKKAASVFRGMSSKLIFPSNQYNYKKVTTNTVKEDQYIFMSSDYNAEFDVEVLASSFHMEKADFMGRLHLIDDFTTFDNDRFDVIREASDYIDKVTPAELAIMADVKAVLVDKEWFQVYDNEFQFNETPVHAGMYWNYFLNVWKTVSFSPFSNAIVFASADATATYPATISGVLSNKSQSTGGAAAYTITPTIGASIVVGTPIFTQTAEATGKMIGIESFGTVLFPKGSVAATETTLEFVINDVKYLAATPLKYSTAVGAAIVFNKVV